jgi:hypothetical protein
MRCPQGADPDKNWAVRYRGGGAYLIVFDDGRIHLAHGEAEATRMTREQADERVDYLTRHYGDDPSDPFLISTRLW